VDTYALKPESITPAPVPETSDRATSTANGGRRPIPTDAATYVATPAVSWARTPRRATREPLPRPESRYPAEKLKNTSPKVTLSTP
jgi:hypothetical protein